jgi:hypothetical protein
MGNYKYIDASEKEAFNWCVIKIRKKIKKVKNIDDASFAKIYIDLYEMCENMDYYYLVRNNPYKALTTKYPEMIKVLFFPSKSKLGKAFWDEICNKPLPQPKIKK